MNRRQFLQATLASATLAHVATSTAADRPRLKLGFLGVSHAHGKSKLQTVQESADWELTGVMETNPTFQEAAKKRGARLMSEEEVLAASDVVAVESDVRDHYRQARAALMAGRHVHLEKAPATTMGEFAELVRLAREKKRLLQMGYMWRFNPGINAVLEAARKGWLGDVFLVRGVMHTMLNDPMRRLVGEFRGGMMFELGCHLIDPMVRLLGRPAKVTPMLRHDATAADSLADNTVAVFEFGRAMGVIASAALLPGAHLHRSFEIHGTGGVAIVKPIEQPVLELDLAKAAGPYKKGRQVIEFPPYKRYVPEFAELSECVRSGKPLVVTSEEDLMVHDALLKACAMS